VPHETATLSIPRSDKSVSHEPRVLVFDLETQRSFADVGGHKNLRQLLVSVAVCYDSQTQSYSTYWERDLDVLVARLLGADLVVGFNVLGFDYPVLAHYTAANLAQIPTLDILEEVFRSLGRRIPLDCLTAATLGAHKSAHGLNALDWWKKNELKKLEAYCRDDVRLTYSLYEFGRRHGYLLYTKRGSTNVQRIPVSWSARIPPVGVPTSLTPGPQPGR
jgi:DEAD/DEAH box helicase domain-containing protein